MVGGGPAAEERSGRQRPVSGVGVLDPSSSVRSEPGTKLRGNESRGPEKEMTRTMLVRSGDTSL